MASTINILFLFQIAGNATTAVLSGIGKTHLGPTILAAINTVVAGVLGFFKGKGQPNRARQLRNDLRKVVEAIENYERYFRNRTVTITAAEAVTNVRKLYDTARTNA